MFYCIFILFLVTIFFCLQFPITVNNYYWNNYNYIISYFELSKL